MKPIVFGLLIACSIATASAQQAPAPTQEPAHKVYVLSGCLEAGTPPAAAFKLTGSSPIGQAPPVARSTPASPASGANSVYDLQPISSVGEQGVNREGLQSHVGARVEVTVRPVEMLPTTPSSPATAETKPKTEEQTPQRYTVIKISRLADSC